MSITLDVQTEFRAELTYCDEPLYNIFATFIHMDGAVRIGNGGEKRAEEDHEMHVILKKT